MPKAGVWISFLGFATAILGATIPIDPCSSIAGKKWVLPREARACMSFSPVELNIKAKVTPVSNSSANNA